MANHEYYAKVSKEIDHGKKYWNTLEIVVIEKDINTSKEIQVGSYHRNYSNFFDTFFHFRRGGKDYALYSEHYTATSVMELPSCKKIAGEDPACFGFCPVEFYVPKIYDPETKSYEKYSDIGFVAGCIWGDDSSWKVEVLNLSELEKGIIKRDDPFDYAPLPPKMKLRDAIKEFFYEDGMYSVELLSQKFYQFKIQDLVNKSGIGSRVASKWLTNESLNNEEWDLSMKSFLEYSRTMSKEGKKRLLKDMLRNLEKSED